MPYDDELAWRIRHAVTGELLEGEQVSEKAMFGGLVFLLHGRMTVAASGQGGLLVRTDPARSDELLNPPLVEPMVMRGRPMAGWLRVDSSGLAQDDQLRRWVGLALEWVRTLPPG